MRRSALSYWLSFLSPVALLFALTAQSQYVFAQEETKAKTASTTEQPRKQVFPVAPQQPQIDSPPPMRYVPGMEEPLVAIGPVTEEENRDLDAALAAFHDAPLKAGPSGDYDDYAKPLLAFVAAHPNSQWNASLYLNIGLGYYKAGYYSRTFTYFENSWRLGRNATGFQAKRMADRAMGELAEMHARLGHADELKAFFADVGDRPVSGSASFLMEGAHEGLQSFEHQPEISYLCGPAALRNILTWLKAKPEQVKVAEDARSGSHGFSLTQLAALADQAGLKYQLIYRSPGQPVPAPSIINWKVHHYAAILDERDGHFRLLDPTFGGAGSVVTAKTADAEGTGYFLVPAEVLAAHPKSGWKLVAANSPEAKSVYGMGTTYNAFPGCTTCSDMSTPPPNQGSGGASQMTVANAKVSKASLSLSDTPVGYKPQKGLPAQVSITYNARDGDQPSNFSFSNLSPLWAHNWQSYVQDDPANAGSNVVRIVGGGGGYDYNVLAQLYQTVYNYSTGGFVAETYDNSQLVRVPATGPVTSYVRNLPDGGQEIYGLSNGATVAPRIMFLTAVLDPAGNKTVLDYDSQLRLVTVTDATGRNTTFSYGLSAYPLLITKITDPFGRSSRLTYDSNARLSSITDPIGITSSFTYGNPGEPDFVTALTTPYGTSKFSDQLDPSISRTCCLELSVAMTDPLGDTEYVHVYQNGNVTGTGPENAVPSGMENDNEYLVWRNAYYWNAHEAASGGVTVDANGNPVGESFSNPDIYHFFHQCCTINYIAPQLASHKRPLEEYREWYNTNPIYNTGYYSGTFQLPTATGRVLDDGSTQLSTASYNNLGLPLSKTDPVGRTTQLTYAANNIDVQTVQQLTAPSTLQTIASYSNYNTAHEPQTVTGADGQAWTYTYNSAGQLLTATDPNSFVTSYNYDSLGRLSTVINANQKVTLSLTYDTADRVETRTDSEGYTLTYRYDNLDRVTKITYPDGTYDHYDYTFQSGPQAGRPSLDLRRHTDRLGNSTVYSYDADRRLTAVTEPLEGSTTRTTSYAYYEDGSLKSLTDPKGNVTYWARDLQSRPVSKTYAYGTQLAETETYAYEKTNSRLHSITDALGQVKTFTYTPDNRIAGITYTKSVNPTPNVQFAWDGYFPRLATMTDGTGTTTYSYHPIGGAGALLLGNEVGPFTNATVAYQYDALSRMSARTVDSTTESFSYDSLSRLVTDHNELGKFNLTYLGQTGQLTSQAINSKVGTEWSYEPNASDRRLKAIVNFGAARSYTFQTNPENLITAMQVEPPSDKSGMFQTGQPAWHYTYDNAYRLINDLPQGASQRHVAAYDVADNTTKGMSAEVDNTARYNALNEMTSFDGSDTIYSDANGNLTGDKDTLSFAWDAENRLIKVTHKNNPAIITSFSYDGLGRRISMSTTGAEPTAFHYMWCGEQLCQSRTSSDGLIRHYYERGEYLFASHSGLYYAQDQIGSVRDVLSTANGSLLASSDYTEYGFPVNVVGASQTDFRYAGMFGDTSDMLYLTHFRAYHPVIARWLSKDPLGELGGDNLYEYSGSSPITLSDRLGLDPCMIDLKQLVANAIAGTIDPGTGSPRSGSTHKCATTVRNDLANAHGPSLPPLGRNSAGKSNTPSPAAWGPTLVDSGCYELVTAGAAYAPQAGDIAITVGTGTSHISIFDGTTWDADFPTKNANPGGGSYAGARVTYYKYTGVNNIQVAN